MFDLVLTTSVYKSAPSVQHRSVLNLLDICIHGFPFMLLYFLRQIFYCLLLMARAYIRKNKKNKRSVAEKARLCRHSKSEDEVSEQINE